MRVDNIEGPHQLMARLDSTSSTVDLATLCNSQRNVGYLKVHEVCSQWTSISEFGAIKPVPLLGCRLPKLLLLYTVRSHTCMRPRYPPMCYHGLSVLSPLVSKP